MPYHCKICGEPIIAPVNECPNCHAQIEPSAVTGFNQASNVKLQNSRTTTVVESNRVEQNINRCPRCGEILMSGANICEICGEVIENPGQLNTETDIPSRVTTKASIADMPAELPKVISTSHAFDFDNDMHVNSEKNNTKKIRRVESQRQKQISVGMLIIICILVALIAAVLTWSIIHFNRTSHTDEDKNEYTTESAEYADNGIGSEESEPLWAKEPEVPSIPAVETATTDQTVNDVPIEGMVESLAGSWTFYGKVNNRYSIGIDMKIEQDGSMSGCYWYESTLRRNGDEPDTYINLEGEVDNTGKVKLTAFKYGENKPVEYWTGHLSGVTPLKFSGSFRSKDKNTTYTFSTATR